MESNELVQRIKTKEYELEAFYEDHRKFFLFNVQSKIKANKNVILEVYTDAVLVFWDKCQKGKLDALKGSPRSYLVGIGKKLMLKKINEQKHTYDEQIDQYAEESFDFLQQMEQDEQIEILDDIIEIMPPECKEIIELSYYNGMRMEEVIMRTKRTKFLNINALNVKKHRCMKMLRTRFMEAIKK